MTKKIVINADFGGFSPSAKAIMRWAKLKGKEMHVVAVIDKRKQYKPDCKYKELTPEEINNANKTYFLNHYYITKPLNSDGTIPDGAHWYYRADEEEEYKLRCDPIFVQVVEELGDEANGSCSTLKIVEIPDDIEWEIEDYDGSEWISEKHKIWK